MRKMLMAGLAFGMSLACLAADAQLERAKLELMVEQAGEMLAEANRKGSATHRAPVQYFFGLIYATGTNLLSRTESAKTAQLRRQYMILIEKNYEAYTKIEDATDMAAATGSDHGKGGSRHRAKRLANADKLRDKELMNAIKKWEAFAIQLKKAK